MRVMGHTQVDGSHPFDLEPLPEAERRHRLASAVSMMVAVVNDALSHDGPSRRTNKERIKWLRGSLVEIHRLGLEAEFSEATQKAVHGELGAEGEAALKELRAGMKP
jgi:hypothetical protein